MKKVDIAYTAGIIDGEGCIHIRRQRDKRYNNCFKYGLEVQVTSTEEWLCKWLQLTWGGSVYHGEKPNPKWRSYWCWKIVNRQALAFLENILCYLHIKRPQAEVAIGFQKRQHPGVNDTDASRILKEADRLRLQELKRLRQEMPAR
jgi:hypothetical protein